MLEDSGFFCPLQPIRQSISKRRKTGTNFKVNVLTIQKVQRFLNISQKSKARISCLTWSFTNAAVVVEEAAVGYLRFPPLYS